MDRPGLANWHQGGWMRVCDFIKLSRSFLTLKAKVWKVSAPAIPCSVVYVC